MTQNVIVYIIGGLLLCYIAWRTYRIFTSGGDAGPCAGCTGCPARDEFLKKQDECRSGGCPHCGPRTSAKRPSQASSSKSSTRSKP